MTKQIPPAYKQTKVGIIPEDWEVVQLGEAVDFLDHRRKPLKDEERQQIQGKYPYYGASGIIDYVNDYIFDEDLLLLGEDGANIIDRSSRLAFIARGKYWVNNHAHVLKPKQMFNHYYLCEYLESLKYDKYNTGTAQPKLNKEIVSSIPIIKPPLKEQEKIAELLSTWDDAIAKQEQLIEQKQVFKKGIMQQIFSQKLRFKDDNGNDYPAWKEKQLDKICTFFSGGTPISSNKDYYNGHIPFIGSGNISSYQVEQFITETALKNSSAKMIEKGDLLLALYGATSGQSAIAKLSGAINQAVLCIRTQELKEFIFYWLQLNKDNIISMYLQGGQGNLSAQIIKTLKLELPTLSEQIKIVDFLTGIDDEISKQTEILDQLKLQKQSLMQKLITGQVRCLV